MRIIQKVTETKGIKMETLVMLAVLCAGVLIASISTGILMNGGFELELEKHPWQLSIAVVVSTALVMVGTFFTPMYVEKWLGHYYGFEAPLAMYVLMFAAPWIVGKIILFGKKVYRLYRGKSA